MQSPILKENIPNRSYARIQNRVNILKLAFTVLERSDYRRVMASFLT